MAEAAEVATRAPEDAVHPTVVAAEVSEEVTVAIIEADAETFAVDVEVDIGGEVVLLVLESRLGKSKSCICCCAC